MQRSQSEPQFVHPLLLVQPDREPSSTRVSREYSVEPSTLETPATVLGGLPKAASAMDLFAGSSSHHRNHHHISVSTDSLLATSTEEHCSEPPLPLPWIPSPHSPTRSSSPPPFVIHQHHEEELPMWMWSGDGSLTMEPSQLLLHHHHPLYRSPSYPGTPPNSPLLPETLTTTLLPIRLQFPRSAFSTTSHARYSSIYPHSQFLASLRRRFQRARRIRRTIDSFPLVDVVVSEEEEEEEGDEEEDPSVQPVDREW